MDEQAALPAQEQLANPQAILSGSHAWPVLQATRAGGDDEPCLQRQYLPAHGH